MFNRVLREMFYNKIILKNYEFHKVKKYLFYNYLYNLYSY